MTLRHNTVDNKQFFIVHLKLQTSKQKYTHIQQTLAASELDEFGGSFKT